MKLLTILSKRCTLAVAFLLFAALFSGCKKNFLDRYPQGEYTSDTYPYPGGSGPYDQYIFAVYDAMRSYDVTVMPFVAAVCIRSDDSDKGSDPGDGPESLQMD